MPPVDKKELVLAQNQYAFIQDETKGLIKVHVGPITFTPSGNDRPVRYDAQGRKFVPTTNDTPQDATEQNPTAPEGSYIILENPAMNDSHPASGQSHAPSDLQVGRKVNIPGPVTFALWPGQVAIVREGHQLKSNEYVRARIYNVDEAQKNWPTTNTGLPALPKTLAVGKVIIVKGTEVNFFIPPTGVEVLPDPITKNQFVSQAVTLERLEYCLLLDENGNKRYERGPAVVFPTATEKFVSKQADSALPSESGEGDNRRTVKLKAIELNDQMGLYVKVIADYDDEVDIGLAPYTKKGEEAILPADQMIRNGRLIKLVHHKAGDELFIKGTEQRIYYPRPEHAIIEYGSEDGKFKRQRYYGIAIPKGEARYVLNKDTGEVRMEKGPKVFLPDPRKEVIVRRVLDKKSVDLWYPGNQEAADYNESLSYLAESSSNYVADMSYNAAMDLSRAVNRGTRGTSALSGGASIAGDTLKRGTTFTPPPSLTLNTKYDGPPTISPWTGYAVQIVDKSGKRRVVKGPTTVLLEYDESLERLTLSTGNPKTTDKLFEAVYLRVDHNKVSDTIEVETRDMVTAKVKVSYRVNFEGDENKWFSVENYVKFMADHCRSLVRAKVKHLSIKQLIDESSSIIRDVILGTSDDKQKRLGRVFEENGMRIYDVEVLKTEITNTGVATMIQKSQEQAVSSTLQLTAKQQELANTKVLQAIEQEIATLDSETMLKKIDLMKQRNLAQHQADVEIITQETERKQQELNAAVVNQKLVSEAESEEVKRTKENDAAVLARLVGETEQFVKRMSALDPKLALAIQSLADKGMMSSFFEAVAPIAVLEQQGIGPIMKRLLKGTHLEAKIDEVLAAGNGSH
jgi:major vault protein